MTEIWVACISALGIIVVAAIGLLQAITLKRVTSSEKARQDAQTRMQLIFMCVGACLNGLHQLGANGPVTAAIKEMDDYKNKKSAA